MTAFNNKVSASGFYKTTVGRVQTPTLAILVEREERIRAFVSRDYWEVHARSAPGRANTRALVRPAVQEGRRCRARGRSASGTPPRAQAIVDACAGKHGRGHRGDQALDPALAAALRPDEPAARGQRPLRLLGAQARSRSRRRSTRATRCSPIRGPIRARCRRTTLPRSRRRSSCCRASDAYAPVRARAILKNQWVKPNKRIFDNTKISDHFAIIPTLQCARST